MSTTNKHHNNYNYHTVQKLSTCHSPNFQHFTDFQITANCFHMLTNSSKKSVAKSLLVCAEISLHCNYTVIHYKKTIVQYIVQQQTNSG